ncbi:MAG: hypothetical protein H6657_26960 [Ardenticatenaceae bacterium]|nr:hypothetical protein [Ardenticatenaceae bacterium]
MKTALGLLIAAFGGIGPLLPAFFPRLGIGTLARLGKVNPLRRVLGLLGWLLIWRDWRKTPTARHGLALIPGTIFALQTQFLEPRRIFVELIDPPHAPTKRVNLADTAVVLGAVVGEQPHAWTFANLVPRHLINDVIGQMPVLAAY